MTIEKTVINHYGREGMAEAILKLARQESSNPGKLSVDDLAPFDDMHIGGRQATEHLLMQLYLAPGMKVLDVGCGIGGAARTAVKAYAADVTGIDLTPQYKSTAEELSEAVGMQGQTKFETGSALEMPFEDGTFEAGYSIHVGMNVQDKVAFYKEAHRVLKPGALFGIYDVMAGQNEDQMIFPVPWADTEVSSFLRTPREVGDLLTEAGFEVTHTENRKDFALAVIQKLFDMQNSGQMPQRPYPITSPKFPEKLRNLARNIEKGFCAPWEMICRKAKA